MTRLQQLAELAAGAAGAVACILLLVAATSWHAPTPPGPAVPCTPLYCQEAPPTSTAAFWVLAIMASLTAGLYAAGRTRSYLLDRYPWCGDRGCTWNGRPAACTRPRGHLGWHYDADEHAAWAHYHDDWIRRPDRWPPEATRRPLSDAEDGWPTPDT